MTSKGGRQATWMGRRRQEGWRRERGLGISSWGSPGQGDLEVGTGWL